MDEMLPRFDALRRVRLEDLHLDNTPTSVLGMTTNHIFLYGPPGAGKTTVGQILARALRLPFMDLDDAIETDTGINIPQDSGEAGRGGIP